MNSTRRIQTGVCIFAVVLLAAILGYRYFGYDWVESVWMVAITVSSVGYSEHSEKDPAFQLFTVAVIVVGMSAAAYTFGGFIQFLTEGEIRKALGQRRMTRDIEKLSQHIIICGFGRSGQMLGEALEIEDRKFIIVDNNHELVEEARARGHLALIGDATEEDVLLEAGVKRAKTLVTALPNDAENVFITLTTRNLSPTIQIVARADLQTTEKKLRQAGANKIVLPAVIGVRQMVRMILRPNTADLMEIMAESGILDYDLDEISVPDTCKLIGVTVRETEAHRKHHLLVVGVKQADGEIVLNPEADYKFNPEDILILMGRRQDIRGFRSKFAL